MEQIIIQKYLEGSSISALLREFPRLNRREINKILLNNNITIRGGRKKKTLTDDQIVIIKKMIEEGGFFKRNS